MKRFALLDKAPSRPTPTRKSTDALPHLGQRSGTGKAGLYSSLGNLATLRALGIGTKLVVSEQGDAQERSAEQAIEDFRSNIWMARKCAGCVGDDDALRRKPLAADGGARGAISPPELSATGGRPLPRRMRDEYERFFGANLSFVRVHTGADAADASRAINARAFTIGRDIYFGSGQYQPGSDSGRQLLAHELAHVVQRGRLETADGEQVIMRQEHAGADSLRARLEANEAALEALREDLRAEARRTECGRLRQEGYEFGYTMSEASGFVFEHNSVPAADDWEWLGRRYRPFVERLDNGQWRLTAPPIHIDDFGLISCHVDGVNRGLDDFAAAEAMWGQIAEALQLTATALSVSAAGHAGMAIGGAPITVTPGPPRLSVAEGRGGLRSSPSQMPPTEVVEAAPRIGVPAGPARSRGPVASAARPIEEPEIVPSPRRGEESGVFPIPRELPRPEAPAAAPAAPGAAGGASLPTFTLVRPLVVPGSLRALPGEEEGDDDSRNCRLWRLSGPFGFDDPLASLYCQTVVGSGASYWIESPVGRAEIDVLLGDTWHECKCGYEGLISQISTGRLDPEASSRIQRLDEQVLRHRRIAQHCGLRYVFVVSSADVEAFLRGRWFGSVEIDTRPFEPCD